MHPDVPGGLYEQVLQAAAGTLPAPRPPRASSAVVPWRRRPGDRALEVFWVERSPNLAFMGGWRAFPGGAVDRRDAACEPALLAGGRPAGLDHEDGRPRHTASPDAPAPGDPDGAPGVVAAAVRELFEETGLLPGIEGGPEAETLRRQLLAGTLDFGTVLDTLPASAARLEFAGRWVTPPFGPVRFDNRFFLLAVDPGGGSARVVPGELASGEWIEPRLAIDRWERGEVLAAPPVLHMLRALDEDGPESEATRARLLDPAEANLGSFRRIEFRPGFLVFPLRTPTLPPASHTNAILAGHGDRALVIDPGTPYDDEIERFERALDEAARRLGRRPRAIVLTHHHPDHVGAVARLAAARALPVWAHRETARRLRPLGVEIERTLEDGEILEAGGEPPLRLRVLHTPGHAAGHLVFHHAEGGTLIGGDILSALSTIVIDPPEGSMELYLASLERAAGLPATTLLPAHGPPLLDPPRHLRQAIEHRRRREERVLAAWRAGARSPRDIVPLAYDDAAPEVRPLAERQVVAHLDHLRRRGLLDPAAPA